MLPNRLAVFAVRHVDAGIAVVVPLNHPFETQVDQRRMVDDELARLDLDGNPRPINIDHAFNNLNFERKGNRVQEELISTPKVLETGKDWELIHLPTHADHFYDVHRIDFDSEIKIETDNCCHVMMLVEGESILIETADGSNQIFAYAETFVVPAAANSYKITNLGESKAKVIKAFLK